MQQFHTADDIYQFVTAQNLQGPQPLTVKPSELHPWRNCQQCEWLCNTVKREQCSGWCRIIPQHTSSCLWIFHMMDVAVSRCCASSFESNETVDLFYIGEF